MTTKTEIEDRARKIVADHYDCDPSEVTLDARYTDDLDGDSLDAVETVLAIEDEFEIEIDDASAERMKTFGDTVEYLAAKLVAVAA